jgi:hypothetical protein
MNVLLVIVAGKVRAATIVRLIEQTRSPAQLVQPGYGSKPRAPLVDCH